MEAFFSLRRLLSVTTVPGEEFRPAGASNMLSGGGHSVMVSSTSSLLLNLEGVLTALVAWLVMREHTHTRVVVGFAAGGALDAMSRVVADALREGLGPVAPHAALDVVGTRLQHLRAHCAGRALERVHVIAHHREILVGDGGAGLLDQLVAFLGEGVRVGGLDLGGLLPLLIGPQAVVVRG